MKKQLLNLSVAFATTVLLAGNALAQHALPTRSEAVKHVTDAIVIDGVADEDSWGAQSQITEMFNKTGVTSESDFSGYLQLCWDANNLYLFVNITDDVETSYEGTGDSYTFDCIEFFQDLDTSIVNADGSYLKDSTVADQIQGRFNRSWDTYTGATTRNDITYEFLYVSGATGWTVEAKLPWVAFMPYGSVPEDFNAWVNKAIGFDCQIADNDGTGRDGQGMWDAEDVEDENNAWKDTRTFGVITLLSPAAVNPVNNSEFGVYPNPATNVVNFKNLEGVTSIEFVNMVGQLVKVVDVNALNVAVNVDDLASGNYFAKINTVNGVTTVKVAVR